MSLDTEGPVPGRSLTPHVLVAVLAVLLVVADQWTKCAIVDMFAARGVELPVSFQRVPTIPVMGGIFHLRIQENAPPVFLLVTSVFALGFIGWYYWSYRDSGWMRIALAFIAGGAVGNLIDRVRLRYVVDFIDVDIGAYQWPFFNLADMFICTGAGMLVVYIIRHRSQTAPEPEPTDGET